MKRYVKLFIKTFFLTIFFGLFAFGLFIYFKYYPIISRYQKEAKTIVENSTKETFQLNETSYIYDDNNNIIAKLKNDTDSEYLTYYQIPRNFINAFIAIEDRSFWDNKGYDLKGIARVTYDAIRTKGDTLHGASTITQQLARLTFLTNEVSMERKIKEIFIASELTKKYTKNDIMEFYCNDVYFANGYYGISSAAKGYFDKDVNELSLSQVAYLCAIPNRPSYYDPYKNVLNAIPRRDKILKDMLELGYITNRDYYLAIAENIEVTEPEIIIYDYNTSYAIDCTIQYLMKLNGFNFKYHFDSKQEYIDYCDSFNEAYENNKKDLYSNGYKIYTSLNKDIQNKLQEVIDNNLKFNEDKTEDGIFALQGASTIIDNSTGKVIAIVGGRSDENNEFGINRAFQSYRQPGSTIKPLIVYTPALENGYTGNSILQNISVTEANKLFESNKLSEINNLTGDTMTLRRAVANSKNGCAYFLFNQIGIANGLSYLENMEFNKITNQDYNLSSALGGLTYGVTTVEMASAYATIANGGEFVSPTCIVSLKDGNGNELFKEETKQVYDKNATCKMTDILTEVPKNGTAKAMNWTSSMPVAAKTGTTNDSKDGWFCGFTPYYTISVWVGFDTPKTLQKLWGSTYPCYIWKDIMEYLISDKEIIAFEQPEQEESTGDEKYLPGRSNDELLSNNYTVGDYRIDYAIVDEVDAIATQIENTTDLNTIEILYQQGLAKIETIFGNNATAKAKTRLDTAYNTKLEIINPEIPQPIIE